eukprot:TRINITY_DN1373_c0_g1_i1.p1 TRINITY_DN1373_c0_g1~~TRINITY_DN1373_c0_g1_i1.p1  ORF type:complete len:1278 (-),score=162.68 TRINITY_DN1373_c0_g1_i1:3869-7702(-)
MPRFGLRAVDMAAPMVLPTPRFPHSEPAVSAQTARTSTCCASIRGAPARRFSSTPNSVTQGEPIVNHLRSFLEAAVVKPPSKTEVSQFTLGMQSKDGVAKRLEWKALEAEIARAEAVTAQTKSALSPKARQRYLLDLRRSISRAMYDLLKDERCEDEDMRSYVTDILVWSNPQNARKSLAKEAVAAYTYKLRSKREQSFSAPVIILATEKAGFQVDQEAIECGKNANSYQLQGDHVHFLEAWREAVTGEAEVLTVVGDSAVCVKDSIEAVLEGSDHHWVSTPILIVMYASSDSAITANLSLVRRLCDVNGINLCVEGPGLAFLAQAARPSDPNECLQYADVLLTNPGSWFGFEECAFTSIHSNHASASNRKQDYDHGPKVKTITSNIQHEDQKLSNAVASVTKLWTVISQIGVPRIRVKVDAVTHIAEALIYHVRDCQSLETSYEGVGCVVRLSYKPSTCERGFSKIEEAEVLSAINRSLYRFVTSEAQTIQVFLVVIGNISMLQFSPLRLLNAGTFWVPEDDQIRKFSTALQQRAEFYHSCRTGAMVLRERISLCSNVELVEQDNVTEDVLQWYGAFRIVPDEWQGKWVDSSSGRHIVTTLTKMLVSELSDSFSSIVRRSPSLKQLLESCALEGNDVSRMVSGSDYGQQKSMNPFHYIFRGGSSAGKKSMDQSVMDLPFSFYIHYDDISFNAPFISVEPKGTFPGNRAYRHACTAAEIIVAVLEVVLNKYRSKGTVESPNHTLVKYSADDGKALTLSSRSPRRDIYQQEDSQAPRTNESSLEDSEVTSTELDANETDGFVSASNTLHARSPMIPYENCIGQQGREIFPNLNDDTCSTLEHGDKGRDHKQQNNEFEDEEVTNEDVPTTSPRPSSHSASPTQLAKGVHGRIPLLGFLTAENHSSDADSEGSDGEYSEDGDSFLTQEEASTPTDEGSDYQDSDTDSSNHSTEDRSSENESSEGSADEEYSSSEEGEGESDKSSSSGDSESECENTILEEIRDSRTETKVVPEHENGNITRSRWLPSLFSGRRVQLLSPKTVLQAQDGTSERDNTQAGSLTKNARNGKVPSSSRSVHASSSASETGESESIISSESGESSSTESSDVSPSSRHRERDNRGRSKKKSSRPTASRKWGWWQQKPSASSGSDETRSFENHRNDSQEDPDDMSSSYSDDGTNVVTDAFSIPSSGYSSAGAQESNSDSDNESVQGSSASSTSSSIGSQVRRSSRARAPLNTGQSRSSWFPYFGYYASSSRRDAADSKGLGRGERKSRTSNRRRRQ